MPDPRPTIEFTEDEWEEFVDGGVGFEIVSDEIFEHRRWSVGHEVVVKRLEDDTFWRGHYERGATENQWYSFKERWGYRGDGKASLVQVFPVEKVVITYE